MTTRVKENEMADEQINYLADAKGLLFLSRSCAAGELQWMVIHAAQAQAAATIALAEQQEKTNKQLAEMTAICQGYGG